ncbi:MAG: hypothetical protein DUD39_03780 [Coriobacteriaceae bacterium]|nr:MAG: hypothetical protein DUD39_03780 [Coriobacteriaceae bacterium]
MDPFRKRGPGVMLAVVTLSAIVFVANTIDFSTYMLLGANRYSCMIFMLCKEYRVSGTKCKLNDIISDIFSADVQL